ncbi:zinc-dependent alcohol dehydrogenase [Candidatus Uabimicrobium amorphum]|uniref:Dehydrogenase n=1 Tax=Uabimicrobium amorphum TaxID=2596890 RepID=A0A5S9F315_UABAM|nr:zinc-binding alcohol dehydrogenase [Candidatus Uabimicrobium amorphum]BBM84032.1 dehydrogenase [Candidatus Uabimicrobium amorphum]
MTKATSLWFEKKSRACLQQTTLQDLPPHFCRVKTICSSISPGTEKLVFSGKIPPSLYEKMRCPYMDGSFDFPIKYGYSLVGRVLEGPQELLGTVVHALHPHQDICDIAAHDLHIISPQIPAERASLASNMETAVTAIWDGNVQIGDRILVVGFGIIGSLVARIASLIPGVCVEVHDICPQKKSLANKMGFSVATTCGKYDAAFHCSASASGLQMAIDCVDFEGSVIELSWYGAREISINLGGSFHAMRKKIICSQVSNIPGNKQNRWDYKRRKDSVFTLLQNPIFDSHITTRVPFTNLVDKFSMLENYKGLACVVNY